MLLVQFALAALMSSPALAASPDDCEGRLALHGTAMKATFDVANLEKLADLFELSPEQKHNLSVYLDFYLKSLDARARGRPISQLRAPYITAQGFKLVEAIEQMKLSWPGLESRISSQFENAAVKFKRDIDALEADLRGGKAQEVIERKRQDIVDLLQSISEREFGGPADLTSLTHTLEALSSNPEKSLFEMKQEFAKLQSRIEQANATLTEVAEKSLNTLKLIEDILSRSLDRQGNVLTYQTLVECELAVGVVEEFATRRFDINPRGEARTPFPLRDTFGLSYAKVQDGVARFAAGETTEIGGDITRVATESDELLENDGRVILPAIEKISKKELLALAFLPIQPLRFHLERDWVSDQDPGPHGGSIALNYDLMGHTTDHGYSSTLLHSKDPMQWIEAINSSFSNWYLLAGGTPGENPPLARADGKREALLRALLYSARYLSRGDKIEWENPASLVRYFFREFLFWEDQASYLLDPTQMEFLTSHGAEYFADLDVTESPSESSIASALDQIVARAARAPNLDLANDPHLRELIAKFPSSAVSAKILVLKAQQDQKGQIQLSARWDKIM